MPLPSSGFGGALVSATSTSPLGSTYTVRGWSSPVAKALTAMPLAAVGLPPAGQPIALATLTVGSQELCGAGKVGEDPKVCSVAAVSCSLQAASGSAKIPTDASSSRFLTGIVVRTFAWMTLLSDKGVINQTLISLGLISQPLKLMYTETGIVVGLVHIYVPFMVLTLTGVIGRIDERLEQAAENLGASPLRAFIEVTLPLSLPGILAGSLLVFALAISAYVTPILLGGFQIMTLPILIYQQISANFNVGFAAALGIVLLMISLLLVIAYNRALGLVSGQRELQ